MPSRRTLLATIGTVGTVAIAGCSNNSGASGSAEVDDIALVSHKFGEYIGETRMGATVRNDRDTTTRIGIYVDVYQNDSSIGNSPGHIFFSDMLSGEERTMELTSIENALIRNQPLDPNIITSYEISISAGDDAFNKRDGDGTFSSSEREAMLDTFEFDAQAFKSRWQGEV